jgi:hypothetical protein
MARFSKKFRSEQARQGRADEAYAAFWREFAAGAAPRWYIARGDRELSVTAYVTRHDGREEEASFRFDFDSEPPHGLRAIRIATTR